MNKRILQRVGVAIVTALAFVACSQDTDESATGSAPVQTDEQGNVVYTMQLSGDVADYDDDATRAVSYTWNDGATLYLRFKNGSTYVAGKAVYKKSDDSWTVTANSSLPTTSTDTNCEVYYFKDEGAVLSSVVYMTEYTACYLAKNATYKHPGTNVISVTAILTPMTWRLRFKGSSGTTITMLGTENEINYFSEFNRTTGEFSLARKDISLTVSGSYTPYLYGQLMYDYYDNNVVVRNDNYRYERDLYAADLPVGQSSYYTIPTANSYSGWIRTGDGGTGNESALSILCSNTWTWDTEFPTNYEGAVWGNAGYAAGDDWTAGIWWGAKPEELTGLLQNSDTGVATGEESANAYMTFDQATGRVATFAANGTQIRGGKFSITWLNGQKAQPSIDGSIANWAYGTLTTDAGSILFPFQINGGGKKPTDFEIMKLDEQHLQLMYAAPGTGSWSEATWWVFKSGGGNSGGGTTPDGSTLYEEPLLNWGASVSAVKTDRANHGYTVQYEWENYVSYEPKYKEKYTAYSFDATTGGLYMSSVLFSASTISFSALCDYANNTLGAVHKSTDPDGTMWFTSKDGKSIIFVMTYSSGDVGIVYREPWSSSPAFKGNKAKIKAQARQMEALSAKMHRQAVKKHN